MAEHGRGAWNNAGVGGTKKYKDETKPGPYYYLGTGVSSSTRDEYAVNRAVLAYQRAVNRRMGLEIVEDGVYGQQTYDAVYSFQTKNEALTGTPWGGIGRETSIALLLPDLSNAMSAAEHNFITLNIIGNTVGHESNWDAGAVGYVDNNDFGLAQINEPSHPDTPRRLALMPRVAFRFVIAYYDNALQVFPNDLRTAVASYNLGLAGARKWRDAGSPDSWTVGGSVRDMKKYVDNIVGPVS